MNNPSWRSEDGQLLRNLREEAGINALVFARNNTLSLAQLKELEQGGNKSFYNPDIKRNTGVKLLKKLGHDPLTSGLVMESNEAAEVGTNQPAPAMHAAIAQVPARQVKPHSDSPRRRLIQQALLWTLGLLSLIVLTTIKPWGLLDEMATDRRPDHLPAQGTATQVVYPTGFAQSATVKNELSPAAAPDKVTDLDTVLAQEPKSEIKSSRTSVTAACDWQHRNNSKIHTPNQPLKPGNYVYLEAQADTELCVLDSQNQKTMLQLKAGMTKSVYGTAPFLVHSQDLQALKFFFQGRRVQETLADMQYLLLNSQPH